jgi:Predicted Permease Membrane Region
MLDLAREIIGTQPILAAFLAIGLGYLVGQINIAGFSLGVGAVLFVGLAIGAFAPKAQITGPIGLTGLVMFLYGIGILYGQQFFEGMAAPAGRRYNFLALVGCAAGLLVALGLGKLLDIIGRLCWLIDQHSYPPSRSGRHSQWRPVNWLFAGVSVRRDRADPVHLFHDSPGQTEIPAKGTELSHGRSHAGE